MGGSATTSGEVNGVLVADEAAGFDGGVYATVGVGAGIELRSAGPGGGEEPCTEGEVVGVVVADEAAGIDGGAYAKTFLAGADDVQLEAGAEIRTEKDGGRIVVAGSAGLAEDRVDVADGGCGVGLAEDRVDVVDGGCAVGHTSGSAATSLSDDNDGHS